MPNRIVIASCSHPALPQPLWPIISSRNPASFVWAGDAIYADRFEGLDWKSIGLRKDKDSQKWTFTFPPPSIHQDATPAVIRGWYNRQWEEQIEYRKFVGGSNGTKRPLVFGTIDDHDLGQNNGDITYRYRRESNLEFMDFLYRGVSQEFGSSGVCQKYSSKNVAQVCDDRMNMQNGDNKSRIRSKSTDPMYQRAMEGKGVYGVQLFDFSRVSDQTDDPNPKWGNGYWIPEQEAMIDPDVQKSSSATEPSYSTTHSVAIFVLDVRSNKTPWPKKGKHYTSTTAPLNTTKQSTSTPKYDFLGEDQWTWFKSALSNSHAAINIIVSGLQIHPQRFPNDGNILEEWSKFPESQQLLYNTVLNSGAKSPLFVSGDVHMAQVLRKDCIRRSELMQGESEILSKARPLIEVTTSGLTHSWGTAFSSQPKHHRWPLKLYSYFISPTFMTTAHYVLPWRDLVIRSEAEVEHEKEQGRGGGKAGKQFGLELNFGEFEFDFDNGEGGSVTARIFGKDPTPMLEIRWRLDQLTGKAHMPGMTATLSDFIAVSQNSPEAPDETYDDWICVPYRGIPHVGKIYASTLIMFIVFCALFFLPQILLMTLFVKVRRWWPSRKQNPPMPNGNEHVNGIKD
ncbi:hypothetical protein ACHAXN_005350 [Cyclotella atomus]